MLFEGVFTVELRGHVPAGKVARPVRARHGADMTLDIELDKPGEPHWLSKSALAPVLKLIVRKVGPRQLRLALRELPRHLRVVK